MPTLCRAGILVECCASGIPERLESHDGPDKCPGDCPCDTREEAPDHTKSTHPRDCDSCAESCNVVSMHSKPTHGDGFAVMLFTGLAVAQVPCSAFLPHQHRSHNLKTMQLVEHIPMSVSDRPLRI